ncbi:MAG: hypothetical protein HY049_11540 [Acidobacteria bacterium]|nr:hypothetical protein [Acidobacteriota bacterium]
MPVHRRGPALAVLLAISIAAQVVAAGKPRPPVAASDAIEVLAPPGVDVRRIRFEAESALRRFRLLFPTSPETLAILVDSEGGSTGAEPPELAAKGVACVRWVIDGREPDISPESGLAHAIGHVLFDARLRRELGESPPPGCAPGRRHGAVADLPPAWLDEAVAAWCEGSAAREARFRRVSGEIPPAIPLWRLLVARRDSPSAGPEEGSGADAGQQFADESYAVGEFLFGRGGNTLADRVTAGAARGRVTTRILADSAQLPGDVDELQREWEDWLRARTPAAGGASDGLAAP